MTHEELIQRIKYDPLTGAFERLAPSSVAKAGPIKGFKKAEGYVWIGVCSKAYAAHRLAWFYVHGEWPAQPLDHINGDKTDNRLANLRLTTPSLNAENRRTPQANSTSGFLGVTFHKRARKWQAAITVAGRPIHLGLHSSAQAAHDAYVAAKRQFHAGSTL